MILRRYEIEINYKIVSGHLVVIYLSVSVRDTNKGI